MKNLLLVFFSLLFLVGAIGAESNDALTEQPAPASFASDSDQDKFIGQFIMLSGLEKFLQRLQERMISGLQQNMARNGTAMFQNEVMKIFAEAYPKDVIENRVKDAMKKNYDEQRYTHLVQMLSTPLSRRMADLESAEPLPADFQNFLSQVASHPLPADRIRLIQSLDIASQASELQTIILFSSFGLLEFASNLALSWSSIILGGSPNG
jgi:hypothetical protein